jgi:hypothetical protein
MSGEALSRYKRSARRAKGRNYQRGPTIQLAGFAQWVMSVDRFFKARTVDVGVDFSG